MAEPETDLQEVKRKVRALLEEYGFRIPLDDFQVAYRLHYDADLDPQTFGCPNLQRLVEMRLSDVVRIAGGEKNHLFSGSFSIVYSAATHKDRVVVLQQQSAFRPSQQQQQQRSASATTGPRRVAAPAHAGGSSKTSAPKVSRVIQRFGIFKLINY